MVSAVAYGGGPSSTVSMTWSSAVGWSVPTPLGSVGLLADAASVGTQADELVVVSGDGALTLTRLGAVPTQQTVTSDGLEGILDVRPDDTVDVLYWTTDAGGWALGHWSDDTAVERLAWSSNEGVRTGSRVVLSADDDELWAFFQWDHALYSARRDAVGTWAVQEVLRMPSDSCGQEPYDAYATCDLNQGYATPLALVRTAGGTALVYGVRTQTDTLTAVYQPGPAGGMYEWSEAAPWRGEVLLAPVDVGTGLGPSEVLLDGVISTSGQLVVDAAGQGHLALSDLECSGVTDWATRYVVIGPSLLP